MGHHIWLLVLSCFDEFITYMVVVLSCFDEFTENLNWYDCNPVLFAWIFSVLTWLFIIVLVLFLIFYVIIVHFLF